VDYLKQNGVHQSVWALFSGGGCYVHVHHEICKPKSAAPEDRTAFFELLTDGFNNLISHVSQEFFKAHPEHKGRVKYDALNNSKRVFKCILSIHKKKPYAVTPLNRDAIKIDLERARIPLQADMLEEAKAWYSSYDPAEQEPLFQLLDRFREPEGKKRSFKETWRSAFKVDAKYFPPCIRHIIETEHPGDGKTRFSGVLSTFLYQMGWSEREAWSLVEQISDRNGLSNAEHIFDSCFGRISCPGCHKIQSDASGYPHLGLKGLDACKPEEECDRWPGDYAVNYALGDVEETKKERLKAAGPTVLDALAQMLQHEDDIEGDKWRWRLYKPNAEASLKRGYLSKEQEEDAHKLLKDYKKTLENFGIDYDDLYPIPREQKSKKEEFGWRIKARAWKVLRSGDPMQYIADSCGRVVLGAETAFKKLTCCISAQNVNQTAGLHPKISGESSGGKTYTVYCFAHHLPWEAVVKGSMSSKAVFYHPDGDRVFRTLDDYQAGNEDTDTVIKQTSSEFHEPYTHRTVANHQAVTLQIGSEQTWCITSVDANQDIQVLNRQIPINVDDSKERTKEVNSKTVKRYCDGEVQQPVDDKVLVCRAIFQILRDQGYIDVRIPLEDRIEWLDTSNRRNPSIFMDLLISITAMNRFQREKDTEGFYLATEDDFQTAKALFTDRDAEELVKRLTARERDVLELLVSNSDGLTRDEIAAKLKPQVAPDRVTQILRGQKGSGGLFQKVTISETKISETEPLSNGRKQTTHKTTYSLKEYDRFSGFDAVVKLKPASDEPTNAAKHRLSNELSNQTTNGEDELSKLSKKEKEREIEKREDLGDDLVSSSRDSEEKAKLLSSEADDSESACLADAKSGLACLADAPASGSIKAELKQAEQRAQEKEEHDKTPISKLLPFQDRFKSAIINGTKTETRRSKSFMQKAKIKPGDVVKTPFGRSLKILSIHEERLGDISAESVKAEGCESLDDFMGIWKAIHPQKATDLDQIVVVLKFEPVAEDPGVAEFKRKVKRHAQKNCGKCGKDLEGGGLPLAGFGKVCWSCFQAGGKA